MEKYKNNYRFKKSLATLVYVALVGAILSAIKASNTDIIAEPGVKFFFENFSVALLIGAAIIHAFLSYLQNDMYTLSSIGRKLSKSDERQNKIRAEVAAKAYKRIFLVVVVLAILGLFGYDTRTTVTTLWVVFICLYSFPALIAAFRKDA